MGDIEIIYYMVLVMEGTNQTTVSERIRANESWTVDSPINHNTRSSIIVAK